MTLSASQILAAHDFRSQVVPVPEWGGEVRIRTFSLRVKEALEECYLSKKQTGIRAIMLAGSICDDTGRLLFDADNVAALEEKSGEVCNRLFEAIAELNKSDVEDDAKN